ncbi:hypothetical protein TWF173_003617 [Orbilia oligospora]|uniref:Apple domain-containing protein n=1 Tax=Arthrobotrys oligospora (strain ATCC 24927 / CBS 115.81 / DSM 1491) TaxID=756982 RepID=G1X5S5_ARTOA|nr:hypothetical protein AOL_s00054g219 [Orbilia oligospora ATCC 24927]EGX51520.1 hypothetical protein AOL_s00054g219 [Orbilia oligospora ATCC 24927]KAF3319166.1 hypothetical protein TWF173_003617 [Orbilia oligospora]
MKTSIILAALAATALSAPAPAPRPQDVDFSGLDFSSDDLSTGPDFGTTKESIPLSKPATSDIVEDIKDDPATPIRKLRRDVKAILKRVPGDCAPQPINNGPQFINLEPVPWQEAVEAAYPPTNPSTLGPYKKVFDGLRGSVSQIGYRGLTTIHAYDINACKTLCDKKAQCLGFNFYVERDPSLDPGDLCPNPSIITNYKCTLWSFPFLAGAADNIGQTRRQFKVVIAASVGYVKPYAASNLANFTSYGQDLYGSINAPLLNGDNTYLGVKSYPNADVNVDYFEPAVCAAACDAQTAYNSRHHASTPCQYKACNFFDAYVVLKDGKAQGLTCTLYTWTWADSYAVNGGQVRSDGVYKVANSYTYTNSRLPAPPYIDTCPV